MSLRLNRAFALEEEQRLPDGMGGFSRSWVTLGTVWADMRAVTGRERAAYGLSVSEVAYRLVLRAAPFGAPSRPRAEQRFREGARVFAIKAVAETDPEGRYLTCYATEETGA